MGLKEIPGTLGFLADEFGNVFGPNLIERTTYVNGDGYVTTNVKTSANKWTTAGVHRLVALAHIPNIDPDIFTEVNHRDSNIKNNAKENLEWVTPSQNNIHSEIMRRGNLYPSIIAEQNNVAFKLYLNAYDAAEDLKVSVLDIWDSIKLCKEINGFKFIHRSYGSKIPNNLKMKVSPYKAKRSIKMLDVDTGDVEIFESFHMAAKKHKTEPSHIWRSISHNGSVRMFKKKYLVAYAEDDFPGYSEEEISNARQHGSKEVIAYNFADGIYYIYSSAKDFILKHGLSKKAVTTSLVTGKLRKIGTFAAVYFSKENAEKLKTFIESPVNIKVP